MKELQMALKSENRKVAELELKQDLLSHQLASLRHQALTKLALNEATSVEMSSWQQSLRGPASESLDGARADQLYKSAQEHFQKKHWAKAREALEKFVGTYSSHSDYLAAKLLLGEVEMQEQKKETAVEHFLSLIEQFPESKEAGFAGLRLLGIYKAENMMVEHDELAELLVSQFSSDPEIVSGVKRSLASEKGPIKESP